MPAMSKFRNSTDNQGFMQDQMFASHTSFGGHTNVNC